MNNIDIKLKNIKDIGYITYENEDETHAIIIRVYFEDGEYSFLIPSANMIDNSLITITEAIYNKPIDKTTKV